MTLLSDRYIAETNALHYHFVAKMAELPPISLTEAARRVGTDCLPEGSQHRAMVDEAFQEWLTSRDYELSYNQMCIAFFMAGETTERVLVT